MTLAEWPASCSDVDQPKEGEGRIGLFGKSFDEKVHAAIEIVRGKFPKASIAAQIEGEVVTLTGSVPDMQTKKAIMMAFNREIETENTLNKIMIPQVAPAEAPKAAGADLAAAAETPSLTAPTETIHEVVRGDTLGAIAKKHYGNAGKYMKIFEANRDILDNPDLIKVGQKLKIPS